MTSQQIIENLKTRLKDELPGQKAHEYMAPRLNNKFFRGFKPTSNTKPSAVLLILQNDELKNELSIIFTLRSKKLSNHSGQISFPGGRCEMNELPIMTAIREANEEIGIEINEIEILGQLSPLYVPPSKSIIYPFVAYINKPLNLTANPLEVEEIITYPISYFINPQNIKIEKWALEGFEVDVPVWTIHHQTALWGATAMILAELLFLFDSISLKSS